MGNYEGQTKSGTNEFKGVIMKGTKEGKPGNRMAAAARSGDVCNLKETCSENMAATTIVALTKETVFWQGDG